MNGIRIRLLFVTILMEALLVGCFTSNNESLINNSAEQVFNLEQIDPVYICKPIVDPIVKTTISQN